MKESIIQIKSKAFAIRSIQLYKYLCEEKKEFVLSKQLLRSGTSIGANAREGSRAQSNADFISKMNIALKEADETLYWLELLVESKFINKDEFDSLYSDAEELVKMLVSIIKTSKNKRIKS